MPQLVEGVTLPSRAVALYDNNSDSSEELSFRSGDILTVLEFNFSGFEGWWLCSMRGNQGICPGNRLKILPHGEVDVQKPPKSIQPVDGGYLYDEPKGSPLGQQYDPLPPPIPAVPTESYDVPRSIKPPEMQYEVPPAPVAAMEQYDIPRPPRPANHQGGEDSVDGDCGEEYSVPRSDGSPLERLAQLEAEATAAVTAVLSLAVSGWRRADRIDTVAVDTAVTRLDMAVNGLASVAAAIANSGTVPHSLSDKVSSLATALSTGGSTVAAARRSLNAAGWSVASLSERQGVPATVSADPLGAAVAAAAALQQDIAAFASFIQGNASLMFAKEDNKKNDDLAYVNIECQESQGHDNGDSQEALTPRAIDPQDLKILEVYGVHLRADLGELGTMVSAFTDCVEQNHPPRVFINIVKQLLLAGGRAVCCGDAVSRSVNCRSLAGEVSEASSLLADALGKASRATRDAAAQFPNIVTVQKMVNSIYAVSDQARRLSHAVVAH